MERRKFLKVSSLFSAFVATTGVAAVADEAKADTQPLPEFEDGQILTTKSLNAMVARINELESRLT